MLLPRELWPIVYRLATSGEWPPHSDAEVAAFFDFARRQSLLSLLMTEVDLPSRVIAAMPRYRAVQALNRKRFELSRDAALELRRVLGTESFLFLKGSDYRYRLYPAPELRQMNDIDIFVPAAEIRAAVTKLAAAGYSKKYSSTGATMAPSHYEIAFEVQGMHVEVHRGFIQRVRAEIDYDAVWERRESFEGDGISGYRLSPSDAVLGQAVSLAKDEFSPQLNRYVDFYLLLQRHDRLLPDCVARAKAWGIERPLFGALHLTSSVFSAAHTASVKDAIEHLLDRPTRRFLSERVLPDPSRERSGYGSGRRVQLWRKFWLIDRVWRRFAFLAYHVCASAIGRAVELRLRRDGALDVRYPKVRSR